MRKNTLHFSVPKVELPINMTQLETVNGAKVYAIRSSDKGFRIAFKQGGDSWFFWVEDLKEFQRFLHELEDELEKFPTAYSDDKAARDS